MEDSFKSGTSSTLFEGATPEILDDTPFDTPPEKPPEKKSDILPDRPPDVPSDILSDTPSDDTTTDLCPDTPSRPRTLSDPPFPDPFPRPDALFSDLQLLLGSLTLVPSNCKLMDTEPPLEVEEGSR